VFWFRSTGGGIGRAEVGVGVFVAVSPASSSPADQVRRAISRNSRPFSALRLSSAGSSGSFRTMWTFGWCLSERYERLATDRSFQIDIDLPRWLSLFEPGHGFVMVTAHLGNFEVGSMLPAFERTGRSTWCARRRPARSQRFIQELLRAGRRNRYVTHFEGEHALQAWSSSTRCATVASSASRATGPAAGGRTDAGGPVPAGPFPLPAGPAALARAAEVPLAIFVFASPASTTDRDPRPDPRRPLLEPPCTMWPRRWAEWRPRSSGRSASNPTSGSASTMCGPGACRAQAPARVPDSGAMRFGLPASTAASAQLRHVRADRAVGGNCTPAPTSNR